MYSPCHGYGRRLSQLWQEDVITVTVLPKAMLMIPMNAYTPLNNPLLAKHPSPYTISTLRAVNQYVSQCRVPLNPTQPYITLHLTPKKIPNVGLM